jgi:3-deoxy-manno-octulosonate cytidylyltransferase (CMP-KDO synthetase)
MTSKDCPSGTARIASVAGQLDAHIVVNVQGDEPLITGRVVDSLIESLQGSDADVATPVYRITDLEDVTNPNVVKVVRGADHKALYFSRSPIPHVRDCDLSEWLSVAPFWGHAGVYAYRRSVLLEYPGLPEGSMERAEKLEQLRLLEAGKQFLTVEIDYHPEAVDTPADLEAVKRIMSGQVQSSKL